MIFGVQKTRGISMFIIHVELRNEEKLCIQKHTEHGIYLRNIRHWFVVYVFCEFMFPVI